MSEFLSQPNYFEGQLIGPNELNRLSNFVTHRTAASLGLLSGSGGILRSVADELKVTPGFEGLTLTVSPGAALSANGYLYHLLEPVVVDLSVIAPVLDRSAERPRECYVYLVAKEELGDRINDTELPEISGFATRHLGFEIALSDRILPDSTAVELCRILLTSETKRPEPFDILKAGDLPASGQIDQSFRKWITLLSGRQLPQQERVALIENVRRTRRILKLVSESFRVQVADSVVAAAVGLEAELRRDNLEEGALRALLNENLEGAASMLEEVRSVLSLNAHREKEKTVAQVLDRIASIRNLPEDVIEDLRKAGLLLDVLDRELLGMNELRLKILHALATIRHRPYVKSETIAPAGRVFHLGDCVGVKESSRLKASSEKKERVSMTARGAVGPGEALEALAVDGGDIIVQPANLAAGKDLLVVGRTYKRRLPVSAAYDWNGSIVHEEVSKDGDSENGVSLFGFVVAGNLVMESENQIRIRIQSYEDRYAFLGLSFYQ